MQSEHFSEPLVAAITAELLHALNHLHTNLKIAHCSLHLNHVFCSESIPDKNRSHFKLTNFENARFIGSEKLPLLPSEPELLSFYPPELLL